MVQLSSWKFSKRWENSTVETVYTTIGQLPLEGGKGFGPPTLHDIYKVVNQLYVFIRHKKKVQIDEIQRLNLNVPLSGERGNITVEKDPAISFVQFARSQLEQENLKMTRFRLKMKHEPARIEKEEDRREFARKHRKKVFELMDKGLTRDQAIDKLLEEENRTK